MRHDQQTRKVKALKGGKDQTVKIIDLSTDGTGEKAPETFKF